MDRNGFWNAGEDTRATGHFPGAIQIVDLYQAGEHLWELARKLDPNDEIHQKRWI